MATVTVVYGGRQLSVPDVLIDTGSASTIFAADMVARVGVVPAPTDILHTVRGVVGREVVYTRKLDVKEVKGINRVVYDISSKPPANIEWE